MDEGQGNGPGRSEVGGGVPPVLYHQQIVARARSPRRWMYVAHGLFGAGRNWRTIARRVVELRPEWGLLLLDLRHHGRSIGFPAPDTIAACVADIVRVAEATGPSPSALLGHSFGGKVALAYGAACPRELRQLWIVDSTPSSSPPEGSPVEMLRAVRDMPALSPSRAAVADALETRGFDAFVAGWMTTNLERTEQGYRWRFDLDALESLLQDFFRTDLWELVEAEAGPEMRFVKAIESDVLTEGECTRIEQLGGSGRVRLHLVEGGHWLNTENPDALVELIASELS